MAGVPGPNSGYLFKITSQRLLDQSHIGENTTYPPILGICWRLLPTERRPTDEDSHSAAIVVLCFAILCGCVGVWVQVWVWVGGCVLRLPKRLTDALSCRKVPIGVERVLSSSTLTDDGSNAQPLSCACRSATCACVCVPACLPVCIVRPQPRG